MTARNVLEALTHEHEPSFCRTAFARDDLEAVATQEPADLIVVGHLLATQDATQDAAQTEAADLTARDEFVGGDVPAGASAANA